MLFSALFRKITPSWTTHQTETENGDLGDFLRFCPWIAAFGHGSPGHELQAGACSRSWNQSQVWIPGLSWSLCLLSRVFSRSFFWSLSILINWAFSGYHPPIGNWRRCRWFLPSFAWRSCVLLLCFVADCWLLQALFFRVFLLVQAFL